VSDPNDPLRRTIRQQIIDLLHERELSFEEIRGELALSVQRLDDHLRHVERSLRGGPERLRVVPARCGGCRFEFAGRTPKRFYTPSRCPQCRGEHVHAPRFEVVTQ
jgi:predicted Zn-ribbon and HTH transcriptional regulator